MDEASRRLPPTEDEPNPFLDGDEEDVIVDSDEEDEPPQITVMEGYQKRHAKIEFSGPYKGTWAKVWVSGPKLLLNALASNAPGRADWAVAQLVLDHNFLFAFDEVPPEDSDDDWKPSFRAGEQVPVPMTAHHVGHIPMDLYRRIVELGMEAIGKAAEVKKRPSKSDR